MAKCGHVICNGDATCIYTHTDRHKTNSEKGRDSDGVPIIGSSTYAVFYTETLTGGESTARQVGIVSGTTALSMVGASTCPKRLSFEHLF